MTEFVISGYIGFDNFGDEAIAGILTEYLKKNGASGITIISSNPKKTTELYGVKTTGMFGFINPILKSDVLISGGGSLLQDVTSLKSLVYYLAVIAISLIFRKKVIIFAQGFTPFRTKIGRFLTEFVLRKCSLITVRDENSKRLLKDMNIDSVSVPDPVWGIEIPPCIEKRGIGVQLRSLPALNKKFLNRLADEIAARFRDEKIKLISLQDSKDLKVLEEFSLILKSKGIKPEILKGLSVKEGIKEISSLEYLIGMRFHACLTAAKATVKTLGINYDTKVKTLSEIVGFPLLEIDTSAVEEGFNLLVNQDTEYKIPEFRFPDITGI